MLVETVFQSRDMPRSDRFDGWRQMMGRTHVPLRLHSDDPTDFEASQRVLTIGAVSMRAATIKPVLLSRTPRLVRQSDPEWIHLALSLRGARRIRVGDTETVCSPFHWHVLDTSRPVDIYAGDGSGPHKMVAIDVPKAMLPLPRNRIDQMIGRQVTGRDGFGALLAQMIRQVVNDAGSYRASDGARLELITVELLSALFDHALAADRSVPPETRQRALTLRIQDFVRRRLHDPQLTPRAIANAHNISVSYLHRLFQTTEDTVAAWIRRERLERARNDLLDAAERDTPIHVIAARWGFPRAADFTRAFRAAYGIPPSACRQGQPSRPDNALETDAKSHRSERA